jgi:hypothetical protein
MIAILPITVWGKESITAKSYKLSSECAQVVASEQVNEVRTVDAYSGSVIKSNPCTDLDRS